jgi:hypothetical protein
MRLSLPLVYLWITTLLASLQLGSGDQGSSPLSWIRTSAEDNFMYDEVGFQRQNLYLV